MNSGIRLKRGFSLIELMFSMAIGSVILIVAASMLGSSGDGYERVGGSVASEREARAAITQLASDLSTAKFQKDVRLDASDTRWPADKIGFFSLQPSQSQTAEGRVGDLCTVNYYVRDLAVGGKTVRCLMRGFRESKDTFDALRADGVKDLFEPLMDDEGETLDEPVAFGVVSFEARPKSRDTEGKWTDWQRNDTTGPEALEVRLVIARRDLAAKLKSAGDWDGTGGAGNLLLGEPGKADRNKDLEIYGTTISFGNHGK